MFNPYADGYLDCKKEMMERIAKLEQQLRVRGEQMESMRSVLDVNWLLDPPIENWFDENGKVLDDEMEVLR